MRWPADVRAASAIRGSLLYMAPEIVMKRHYDASADLWSVGVILYECIFSRAPFHSATESALLARIASNEPVTVPAEPAISPDVRRYRTPLRGRPPYCWRPC